MKSAICFSLMILGTGVINAQEVVSTQGDSYSNGSGSIDFTIGEVVINTGTDGTHDLTQGFHQTNWNLLGVEDHTPTYAATIFPNPVENALNIQASKHENVDYVLFDATGRKVAEGNLTGELTTIPVAHLAVGKYSLALTSLGSMLKEFKLVKHQ